MINYFILRKIKILTKYNYIHYIDLEIKVYIKQCIITYGVLGEGILNMVYKDAMSKLPTKITVKTKNVDETIRNSNT